MWPYSEQFQLSREFWLLDWIVNWVSRLRISQIVISESELRCLYFFLQDITPPNCDINNLNWEWCISVKYLVQPHRNTLERFISVQSWELQPCHTPLKYSCSSKESDHMTRLTFIPLRLRRVYILTLEQVHLTLVTILAPRPTSITRTIAYRANWSRGWAGWNIW